MRKKRASLESVFSNSDDSTQVPAAKGTVIAAQPTPAPRRPGVKQQTLYLPHEVHKRLKLLAFEEDKRQHDLLLEGLDLLFESRGLPGIREHDSSS